MVQRGAWQKPGGSPEGLTPPKKTKVQAVRLTGSSN